MKCKKHLIDTSSKAGVCASCLRERLAAIITAQQGCRKSESQLPQFVFPRSVSPYVSHRKSESSATWKIQGHHRRFYSTPQVGPNGFVAAALEKESKTSKGRFASVLHGFFRSKSEKTGLDTGLVGDPGVSIDSIAASPSWFSMIVTGRRKKQVQTFSVEEVPNEARSKTGRISDRGLSPSNMEEDEHCREVSSGYSSESSQGWKQTPRRTPAARRCKGRTAAAHSRNASGLAFCLNPLVRPTPNRKWTQKAAPPETQVIGVVRAPPKPQLSAVPSFCRNRSRKLADIGKQSYNPNPVH